MVVLALRGVLVKVSDQESSAIVCVRVSAVTLDVDDITTVLIAKGGPGTISQGGHP